MKSRLQFSDSFVKNAADFKEIGLTEVKFENTVDRESGVAKPRQIERVNKGVLFDVNILYDMANEGECEEDMQNLAKAMRLLQLDYLGGHGTRGSGRVSFRSIHISVCEDEDGIAQKYMDVIRNVFKEVEEYELFSVKATV